MTIPNIVLSATLYFLNMNYLNGTYLSTVQFNSIQLLYVANKDLISNTTKRNASQGHYHMH